MDQLPYVDEHHEALAGSADDAWAALLETLRRQMSASAWVARLLGCNPAQHTDGFAGRPGDAVPGFRVVAAEPGRRLTLRGQHRFSEYELTFALGGGRVCAVTHAAFPGVLGRLYRAVVIGSGGHKLATRGLLRRIARAAHVRSLAQ